MIVYSGYKDKTNETLQSKIGPAGHKNIKLHI